MQGKFVYRARDPDRVRPCHDADRGDNGAVFIDLRAGGSQRLFSSAFTRLDGGQPEGVARHDWQRHHRYAGGLCHWPAVPGSARGLVEP